MDKLEWSALEYEERERSNDWFWALGIIVATGALTSIIYGNYFFAVLLVLSGILLGFFAKKTPDVVSYELNNVGLQIRTRLYPYENIKSFWVRTNQLEEMALKPVLFIKSERFFMPVLAIPIENNMASEIKSIMLAKNITEEEMREHVSEKIMDSLGF